MRGWGGELKGTFTVLKICINEWWTLVCFRAHLEEYIEHLPLETDKKAMKALRLCEDLDMLPQGDKPRYILSQLKTLEVFNSNAEVLSNHSDCNLKYVNSRSSHRYTESDCTLTKGILFKDITRPRKNSFNIPAFRHSSCYYAWRTQTKLWRWTLAPIALQTYAKSAIIKHPPSLSLSRWSWSFKVRT